MFSRRIFSCRNRQGYLAKFFYFTEIIDLILSLSEIYHVEITEEMIEEAQIASKAYLSTFLQKKLLRRKQSEINI